MRRNRARSVRPDPGSRPLATAVHCAFDLIELDGEDLRRQPIEARKRGSPPCCAAPIRRSCSMSTSRATADTAC